jgi:hypothetical protein
MIRSEIASSGFGFSGLPSRNPPTAAPVLAPRSPPSLRCVQVRVRPALRVAGVVSALSNRAVRGDAALRRQEGYRQESHDISEQLRQVGWRTTIRGALGWPAPEPQEPFCNQGCPGPHAGTAECRPEGRSEAKPDAPETTLRMPPRVQRASSPGMPSCSFDGKTHWPTAGFVRRRSCLGVLCWHVTGSVEEVPPGGTCLLTEARHAFPGQLPHSSPSCGRRLPASPWPRSRSRAMTPPSSSFL